MATPLREIQDQVSAEEWQTRQDLAALYRIVAMYGWDDLVFTHLTARVPGPDEHFLINPYGMMFEEITASSLVKVDLAGNKMMETPYPINPAGYTIHSAIHEIRSDAACVMHLHTRAGAAVACQREGLLPISQQASIVLPMLTYHEYEGIALYPEEKARLQADLGQKPAMLLWNHGTLTLGRSIPEAFLAMYMLETACQIQVAAMAGGSELVPISQEIIDNTPVTTAQGSAGLGDKLLWPALLRKLDRRDPSYRD